MTAKPTTPVLLFAHAFAAAMREEVGTVDGAVEGGAGVDVAGPGTEVAGVAASATPIRDGPAVTTGGPASAPLTDAACAVAVTAKAPIALVLDRIFPDGIYLPDYFFDKNVVHLPTMKCHIYTTTTGAMKNAFGGLLNTKRHCTHTWIHETLVDLLAIQQEIHSGVFAVMDGTLAGNGAGPRTMTPVQMDLMLASADQVAIDALSAQMMGFAR
jgi:hypothetical protein